MKKHVMTLMALVCAIFILSLTGCKKDYAEMIIGTWQETEAIYTEKVNGETTDTYSLIEPGETITLTFNMDNTYKTVSEDGTYEDTGTWSITDDKLTIFEDDFGMTFDIEKLDKKNLTIVYNEEFSYGNVSIVIKMKRI
ncbi:MAG: lipocalin family protein [Bacteroidales bacterium]|nr:lipocalin family protein [Bacteroidales bacterium]